MTSSTARLLLAVLMVLTVNFAHAETSKTFSFENQREETFDLENFLKETRYKTETQDATCYRQEPYIKNVCRDVTHYRQECQTIPAHQECHTAYDQVCHTENSYEQECHMEQGPQQCRVVVHYRQECHQEGGGQQCHTVPGDVVCRVINGENKCEKIPPHQECSGSPGRQVCNQVPYEERECTNGSSHQVCNQVNRPHQVCQNVPRQQCDYVPAEQQCSQVPYTVNECKDETFYNQIPYACKKDVQVPYEVTLKTHEANVQFLFDTKSADVHSSYTVDLDVKGGLTLTGRELDDSKAVAFVKKDVKTTAQGDINTIKAIYKVALYNRADLFNVNSKGISDVSLSKHSMSFIVNGKFDQARSNLAVKISKKGDSKFDKVLTSKQFSAKFDGTVTRIEVDLESLGCPKLTGLGIFNKNYDVGLKLKLDYSDVGEVLLPKLGEISVGANVAVEAQ
ncbi:MAG: hypothetical protein H7177_15305 [Rhizobacter sp.]|nr:hypothetical protein [Bacteriovorax sp.]